MTLLELQAELYQNLTEYLDVNGLEDYVSDICDVVENTFEDNFYDGSMTGIDLITKTLDTTPTN